MKSLRTFVILPVAIVSLADCNVGPNYTHFKSKEFDELYAKASTTTNDSLRFEMYKKMDQLVMDEAPIVVLYYDQVVRLCQNNISGLGNNAMNLLTIKNVNK